MKEAGKHSMDVERLMFWGFCGLFFLIPVATSPAVIVGLITLFIWLLSGRFIKDRSWLKQEWTVPVAAMMLLPVIGLSYTDDLSMGLDFAKKGVYWLCAFAITGIALSASRTDAFLKAFIGGASFTSALFLLQLAGVVPMRQSSVIVETPVGLVSSVGLFNQWGHITLSLLLTFGILLLSFYFREAKRKRDRAICVSLMLVQFFALSMLLSDSGHLAFILLSPVLAYNVLGRRAPLKIIAVSALVVGALFLSPVTQSRLHDAVSGTITYKESKSLTPVQGRLYMWTGALKIYSDNPVFGVGTGGYKAAMRELRAQNLLPDKGHVQDPAQPHNSFLYMAVSFGIPGVAVLLWLFIILLRNGWRNRNTALGFSVLAYTLVLLIGSLTDSQILHTHTAMLFALFTGLQGNLGRDPEKIP